MNSECEKPTKHILRIAKKHNAITSNNIPYFFRSTCVLRFFCLLQFSSVPFQFKCVVLIRISRLLYKVTPAKSFANIFEIQKSKFLQFKLPCIKPEDRTAKKDLTHSIQFALFAQRSHRKRTIRTKKVGENERANIIFIFTRHSSFLYVSCEGLARLYLVLGMFWGV